MDSYLCLKASKFHHSTPKSKTVKKAVISVKKLSNEKNISQSKEEVFRRRTERFGSISPSKPEFSSTPSKQIVDLSTLNLLMKRKERFGESVSSLLKTIENKEKLLKRQVRFSNKSPVSTVTDKQMDKVKILKLVPKFSPQKELFQTIDQIEGRKNVIRFNHDED